MLNICWSMITRGERRDTGHALVAPDLNISVQSEIIIVSCFVFLLARNHMSHVLQCFNMSHVFAVF